MVLAAIGAVRCSAAVVYADTCVEAESGDIAGHIVTMHDRGVHPHVTLIWSEGALMAPIAVVARFNAATGRLTFTGQTGEGIVRFEGHADRRRFVGSIDEPWAEGPRPLSLRAMSAAQAEQPSAQCGALILPAAPRDRR